MTEKEIYHPLLLQKKELVFRLLRMANDTALSEGTPEKKAEQYIGFVEAREEIICELKELNDRIAQIAEPAETSEEAALLNQEIEEMINQMSRLELGIRKRALGITACLRRELQAINNRKKTSGAYEPGKLFESNI